MNGCSSKRIFTRACGRRKAGRSRNSKMSIQWLDKNTSSQWSTASQFLAAGISQAKWVHSFTASMRSPYKRKELLKSCKLKNWMKRGNWFRSQMENQTGWLWPCGSRSWARSLTEWMTMEMERYRMVLSTFRFFHLSCSMRSSRCLASWSSCSSLWIRRSSSTQACGFTM